MHKLLFKYTFTHDLCHWPKIIFQHTQITLFFFSFIFDFRSYLSELQLLESLHNLEQWARFAGHKKQNSDMFFKVRMQQLTHNFIINHRTDLLHIFMKNIS